MQNDILNLFKGHLNDRALSLHAYQLQVGRLVSLIVFIAFLEDFQSFTNYTLFDIYKKCTLLVALYELTVTVVAIVIGSICCSVRTLLCLIMFRKLKKSKYSEQVKYVCVFGQN